MSRRYYALGLGGQKQHVVESATPTLATAGVEVSIDMAGVPDTGEFRRLVEVLVQYVLEEKPSHFGT
jgi:hypothetical protein